MSSSSSRSAVGERAPPEEQFGCGREGGKEDDEDDDVDDVEEVRSPDREDTMR